MQFYIYIYKDKCMHTGIDGCELSEYLNYTDAYRFSQNYRYIRISKVSRYVFLHLIPKLSDETFFTPHDQQVHDDVTKWKHFPRYWHFVRGIHRWPVDSSQKGQWRGEFVFSLICAWAIGWANNHDAGDLRRHRAHYDATVIFATALHQSLAFG